MSLRAFIEQESLAEEAARIERDRPFRQAEESFKQTARELAALEKDRVAHGRDTDFTVDRAVRDISMSVADAARFNSEQAVAFCESTPEYYPSDSNQAALIDYLYERNGVQIVNVATLTLAFNRLRSFGLLEEWPIPEPEPLPVPIELEQDQPPQDSEPDYEVGIDPTTQEARRYNKRQIAAMSADEYRLTFGLRTINRSGEPSR